MYDILNEIFKNLTNNKGSIKAEYLNGELQGITFTQSISKLHLSKIMNCMYGANEDFSITQKAVEYFSTNFAKLISISD